MNSPVVSTGAPVAVCVRHQAQVAGRQVTTTRTEGNRIITEGVIESTNMIWDGNVWDNFFYQGTTLDGTQAVRISRRLVVGVVAL